MVKCDNQDYGICPPPCFRVTSAGNSASIPWLQGPRKQVCARYQHLLPQGSLLLGHTPAIDIFITAINPQQRCLKYSMRISLLMS
ncbi:hypothetical protein CDAR_34471 [Caerostris darwini]|uniref:Uncharacterized protein n=1 Tax=Caerostris darwini TaxID=1538125 RepID=A0AAV4MMR4_9ARAC|nr:hypothetical protein CDAR_34471 [Caerostris darwini]